MYIATGKYLHAFICKELTIHYQVIYRVNYMANKEKYPEMTKGCPIFEWIPGIPIIDKYNEIQNEDDKIASTHEDENDDYITENGEEG